MLEVPWQAEVDLADRTEEKEDVPFADALAVSWEEQASKDLRMNMREGQVVADVRQRENC